MSSILRRAVYPAMSRAGMFSRSLRAGEVCALTYHGVCPEGFTSGNSPTDETLVAVEQFRGQLKFLKSRYQLITPEEFRSWWCEDFVLPERALLLTCDDGLLNCLTEMLPILEAEQVKCLFFVTGASTGDGRTHLWYEELYQILKSAGPDKVAAVCHDRADRSSVSDLSINRCWQLLMKEFSRLSCQDRRGAIDVLRNEMDVTNEWRGQRGSLAERRYGLMNGSELRQIVAAGMTVGAHTMSHPVLSEMTAESVDYEIRASRSQLESCLQQEVWALAYPFGDESSAGERESKIAEAAGFKCAFMNCGGGAFGRTGRAFRLPRAHITSAMQIPELEARLTGFFEPLRKRVWAAPESGEGE